jgi:PIN domain nuclease of toxin-antitoxin system
MTYLDTHVVAWLYAGRLDLLSERARRSLENDDLLVSPMAVLELQYLFEIRRTAEPAAAVLAELGRKLGLAVCELPFPEVAAQAARSSWTRDPFDRLIGAHAQLAKGGLLTKDQAMLEHVPGAFWH